MQYITIHVRTTVVLAYFGHYVRVLNESGHHELPAQLFAGVGEIGERGSHEGGPEDDGQVTGRHLVHVPEPLDPVEVEHEVAESGEVGARHLLQDLLQSDLLLREICHF